MAHGIPTSRSRRPGQGRRSGFTIVELTIVAGIVALLVAVLAPSLSIAREQARRTVCRANLRQIGQGWSYYLSDNSDKFYKGYGPTGLNAHIFYGGKVSRRYTSWEPVERPLNRYMQLEPIMTKGADVFACPSDRSNAPWLVKKAERLFDDAGTSYYMNHWLIGQWVSEFMPAPLGPALPEKLPRLPGPSGQRDDRVLTITQVDEAASHVVLGGDAGMHFAWNRCRRERQINWHRKADHHMLLFLDGHAAFVPMKLGHTATAAYTFMPFRKHQTLALENPICRPN